MKQPSKSQTPKTWFAVKSVFRWVASGKPRFQNSGYIPDATLVEERVVIFQARDHQHAVSLGKQEAKNYSKETHINPLGQKVKIRFLKSVDAFELFEVPGSGVEVYSATEVLSSSVSDSTVRVAKFGKPEKKSPTLDRSPRLKFSNAEFFVTDQGD